MKIYCSWRITFALILIVFVTSVHASPLKVTIEGAKNEGKMVYYAVLSVPESRALLGAFEKKYPFLKTELFRLGAEKMRSKILTEARAGHHVFDVTSMNVVDAGLLIRQGIVGPYKALAAKGIPEGLKDKKGYWTALYLRQFVLAYNSQAIPPKEVPKDWWDLLHPKWKGRIGMDEEETEWYAALSTYWGKEKAQKLMRGLEAQNLTIHRGHTLIAQLTSAGAFDLSIAYGNRIEEMKGKGAPLDFVDTTDPIVTSPSVIALSAHSPHPNAARLYIEFLISIEGQRILKKFGRVAAHKDVSPPSPKLNPKRLKTYFVSPKISDRYEEYQKEYFSIFRR